MRASFLMTPLVFLARDRGSSDELPLEVFSVMQHRPREPGVLGCNGNHGFPVASSFDELARPAAETVLFVSEASQYRACSHDEQAAQVGVSGFGDAAETGFAAAAVLTGDEADPGGKLAPVTEIVALANAGDQSTGGGGTDAGELHEATAAGILFGSFAHGAVVVVDAGV